MVRWLLALLALSSCVNHANEINVTAPSGEKLKLGASETLRINLLSEPPTLDWQLADDTTSSLVITNITEGLVGYDLASSGPTMKLAPALALKWESSEKARIWKFTLRNDVKWTDGVPFTAQHAIDGIKRLLDKATASPYAYFVFAIKNAKAFNEGKVPWSDVGVKQTGPLEITFELEKPMGFFPSLLAHASTYPVRLDVVQKYGPLWTQPENIVTLGAFKLRVWQHDNLLVLERNDAYYGDKPALKYIAAYMVQEQMTAINLFDSGRLDSVYRPPSIELKKLRNRPEYHEGGTLMMNYYGFNIKKKPMDNPLVRRAINEAIDRKEIAQMLGGGEIPLPCWLVPGVLGYTENVGIKFNPEKAREDLAKSGYAKGLPKIEIHFNTNEDHQRIAENVQAQLRRNLGLTDIEVKNEEWKVYLNDLKTNPPQIFRFGWMADYADPDNFMTVMASYSENNHVGYKNPKYDELIERAATLTDDKERTRLYIEAQKLMCEEDDVTIPLVVSRNHLLISRRVHGYPINVIERYEFKGVTLDR